MHKEIKIVPRVIELELNKLATTQSNFTTRLNSTIEGDSQLDLVNDLVIIKESYTQIADDYLSLLERHLQLTREAVEKVQRVDHEVGRGINMLED